MAGGSGGAGGSPNGANGSPGVSTPVEDNESLLNLVETAVIAAVAFEFVAAAANSDLLTSEFYDSQAQAQINAVASGATTTSEILAAQVTAAQNFLLVGESVGYATYAEASLAASKKLVTSDAQYALYSAGGAGGQNGATVTVNNVVYGPYGQGGFGGDSISIGGFPGQDGGVVLWWGTGVLS